MPTSTKALRKDSAGSLLLLALIAISVVSVTLAYQALAAARSHRNSVESVLADYAASVAWEYSRVVRQNLSAIGAEAYEDVTRESSGSNQESRERRESSSEEHGVAEHERLGGAEHGELGRYDCECPGLQTPLARFRLDLSNGTIVSSPDTFSSTFSTGLVETLTNHRRLHSNHRSGFLVLSAGALLQTATIVEFTTTYGRQGVAQDLIGHIVIPDAYAELLANWFATEPLLPPSLSMRQPNDSLVSVALRSGRGDVTLFTSSPSYPPNYVASDTMGPEYGGLVVDATIRPEIADQLVIGGLPRSRLPSIAVLLLITVVLGTTALYQNRRENRLARLREGFVSGVSHELRTPLTQIRLFVELLVDGDFPTAEERMHSLGIVDREARRLSQLVENVLRFSSFEPGTQQLKLERVVIKTIVDEVVEAYHPLARARAAAVIMKIEDDLLVHADRDALKQVLLNLIDNAVKYGPEGQTVTVQGSSDGATVRLSVEDEGTGIPTSDRERVWEPYWRSQQVTHETNTGTGLGLAVVRELVRLMDGDVSVETGTGGGARFSVQLRGVT